MMESIYNRQLYHFLLYCFTNGAVNLQYGLTKIKYNICLIRPYKSDTNVEDINPKNMYDGVNI